MREICNIWDATRDMTCENYFRSSHLYIRNIKWELELDYINLSFINYLQNHNLIPIFQFGFTDLSLDILSETGTFLYWGSCLWDLEFIITRWIRKCGFFLKKWKSSVHSFCFFVILFFINSAWHNKIYTAHSHYFLLQVFSPYHFVCSVS